MSNAVSHQVTDPGFRDLVQRAEAAGWTVTLTRRRHLRFQTPDGQVVFTGSTSGDYRGVRNAAARLRRAGLPIPHKWRP